MVTTQMKKWANHTNSIWLSNSTTSLAHCSVVIPSAPLAWPQCNNDNSSNNNKNIAFVTPNLSHSCHRNNNQQCNCWRNESDTIKR